MGDRNK